jgi:hypothetical protein
LYVSRGARVLTVSVVSDVDVLTVFVVSDGEEVVGVGDSEGTELQATRASNTPKRNGIVMSFFRSIGIIIE